jgi:hypothetical protein
MANASVEKLKALGIRHGEKAVVGLTATAFVVLTALAIMHPTLDMKPEELSTQASNAQANLSKQQDIKDVLAKLEKDGLQEPNFEKVVQNQLLNALKPGDYKARQDWVTPEPGAGLIRDQPELIAPTELFAFPGRGGVLMYSLDDKGERIIDTGADAKKKGRGRGNLAMGGGAPREEKPEEKKRREAEEAKRQKGFAGKVDPAKEKDKEEELAAPAAQVAYKEETKGKRWVVITGVIDNEQLKKNYLLALKNPAIAYPNYKRLDVERRSLQSDATWTEWATFDQNKNYEVLDNTPELDTEYVPEPLRPSALVDPLPFLRAGYWTGVHVARLVPPDLLKTKNEGPGPGPGAMGEFGGMGERMGPGGKMGGMMPGGMMGGSSRMGGMAEGPGSMGAGGDPEESNFTKHEEKALMLRSLDFTVDPNTTYQFRVRIVVVNPNKDHTDVNPGVDVESKELLGPWSQPTDPVTVPADIAAYANTPEPASRRNDQVNFEVIKWDTGTGQTVVKNDIAAPGEVVGEYGTVQVPNADGEGAKSTPLDFNSRAIVLDTIGGRQKLPEIGVERNPFEVPAIAMVVEPDGSVVIRSQAIDRADEVRKDMDANYKQAIEDSVKKREPGGGSRMPGSGDPRSRGNRRRGGGRR